MFWLKKKQQTNQQQQQKNMFIAHDKQGYPDIFLISQQTHVVGSY